MQGAKSATRAVVAGHVLGVGDEKTVPRLEGARMPKKRPPPRDTAEGGLFSTWSTDGPGRKPAAPNEATG
jgi:hypothetical protein